MTTPDAAAPALDASHLRAWLDAQCADDPIRANLLALDWALAGAPGHRLLTILVYFDALEQAQRIYSSQPVAYPLGGRKTLAQAPRMRQVLGTGQPFIGRNKRDIIDSYADHALLLSMGCESIVNMPVRWGRRVLGTVNLLGVADQYGEGDLPRIEAFSQLAVPAFLATLLHAQVCAASHP